MKTAIYAKVNAKAQAILADKSLNVEKGTISFSEIRKFDKSAYKAKQGLKPSQTKWVEELHDEDGTLICTINNSEGQFPVSQWVSTVKAVGDANVGCFDVSAEDVKASQGWKFSFLNGVMLAHNP